MPRTYTYIDQIDNIGDAKILNRFDGGLNTASSNEILLDHEAIVRKNWSNDTIGALEKVAGYTKKNSSAMAGAPITGLFRVYKASGSDELLAICNGTLYYSDNEGTTFSAATSGTGLSASAFNTGCNYNDLFFFTNSTDNIKVYTPSTNTMAASTDVPTDACKVLLKRADRRMIALVNTTNSSTLYWSKLNPTGSAADDWSATSDAGYISIDGAKSDPLTGAASLGSYDLVFKDYTTFKTWCYPDAKAVRILGSPGCAAPYSVAVCEGLVIWLGHDAVWMWDGNKFLNVSGPIKETIKGISQTYITNAFGAYVDGYYYLFYTNTGDTTNQDCLVYDVKNSQPFANQNIWYERDNLSMNCPCVFEGVGDANELYAGSSASDGFVYRLNNGTSDNTGNITSTYQTKYYDMGISYITKRFSKINIRYYNTSGTFTVTWYTNRGSTSGSFTITGTGGEATHTENLPDTAVGKDLSLSIVHVGSSTAPIIRNIQIDWEALYG